MECQDTPNTLFTPIIPRIPDYLRTKGFSTSLLTISLLRPVESSGLLLAHRGTIKGLRFAPHFNLKETLRLQKYGGFTCLDLDPTTRSRSMLVVLLLHQEIPVGVVKLVIHPPHLLEKVPLVTKEEDTYIKVTLKHLIGQSQQPMVLDLGMVRILEQYRKNIPITKYFLYTYTKILEQIAQINSNLFVYAFSRGYVPTKFRKAFFRSLIDNSDFPEVQDISKRLGLSTTRELFGLVYNESYASQTIFKILGLHRFPNTVSYFGFGPAYGAHIRDVILSLHSSHHVQRLIKEYE